MYLPCLNIPDLFIPLWQGLFECNKTNNKALWTWMVLTGVVWKEHRKMILMREEITPAELREANEMLTQFEAIYCQCQTDQLHFVHPSIHTPSHMPYKTTRWTLERTISNLREEIKQHSDPYVNLSQHTLQHCQVNTLKAMIPDLEPPENPLPHGSLNLGDSYVLLTATDNPSVSAIYLIVFLMY
ncbi:hypothetical protein DFH08DRAFT_909723 [Mycena albidolilacea]|uniref:Uncharacterized protein n=1 Tax=Mycena albidolilacea TaxID=1033008 RepID=A0AAD7AR16_9AGAR|nr:hypothetical protein DFH08DRAFT_909723 [Mycena albidolilacea]